MTKEESRQVFEEWITEVAVNRNYQHMEHLLKRFLVGDIEYVTTWVDMAWMGWQARDGLLDK